MHTQSIKSLLAGHVACCFPLQGNESLLDALLRSMGNMAPSPAAAGVLSAPDLTAAVAELQQHEHLAVEAKWVLGNLGAMNRCLLSVALPT